MFRLLVIYFNAQTFAIMNNDVGYFGFLAWRIPKTFFYGNIANIIQIHNNVFWNGQTEYGEYPGILSGILSISRNIIIALNNVMWSHLFTNWVKNWMIDVFLTQVLWGQPDSLNLQYKYMKTNWCPTFVKGVGIILIYSSWLIQYQGRGSRRSGINCAIMMAKKVSVL